MKLLFQLQTMSLKKRMLRSSDYKDFIICLLTLSTAEVSNEAR